MSRSLRIGITGHRDLGEEEVGFVAEALHDLLARLKKEHPKGLVALSALAEGVDTLFAEAALALSIPLEVVIPFEEYAKDFPPGPPRQHFEQLLAYAQTIHRLPYRKRSDDAYLAGGIWIADHSDLLVAVWDGQPARGKGGTGDVVAYARQNGNPMVQINPVNWSVIGDH